VRISVSALILSLLCHSFDVLISLPPPGDTLSSAINAGYISDPYATMVAKVASSSVTRRAPLINVGTHHRTWALDRLIDSFLDDSSDQRPRQVVSLGAGSDTRFWRLMVSWLVPSTVDQIECMLIRTLPCYISPEI
jgi:[phosphatase 2A protein]-leucine-carboxy methyltransferase